MISLGIVQKQNIDGLNSTKLKSKCLRDNTSDVPRPHQESQTSTFSSCASTIVKSREDSSSYTRTVLKSGKTECKTYQASLFPIFQKLRSCDFYSCVPQYQNLYAKQTTSANCTSGTRSVSKSSRSFMNLTFNSKSLHWTTSDST